MGWSSATSIFDTVVKATENYIPEAIKAEVYWKVYQELRYGDWDTVDESDYFYSDWMIGILDRDDFFHEYYPRKDYLERRDQSG